MTNVHRSTLATLLAAVRLYRRLGYEVLAVNLETRSALVRRPV